MSLVHFVEFGEVSKGKKWDENMQAYKEVERSGNVIF